jgi:hypothetical protein
MQRFEARRRRRIIHWFWKANDVHALCTPIAPSQIEESPSQQSVPRRIAVLVGQLAAELHRNTLLRLVEPEAVHREHWRI